MTSVFAGEVEIFDFVTEREKRCIAAKRENWWGYFGKVVLRIYVWKLYWGFGEMLYRHTVVGNNTYFTYTKMGARIHRTVALRRDCECMKLENISAPEYLEVIFFGSIFYWHNVVGGVVNCTGVIYGGAMRCAVTFWEPYRANMCL